MKEVWKDIVGYEGLYQVSNLGSVKSLERTVRDCEGERIVKERILKATLNSSGYLRFGLSKNSIGKTIYVHILVFEAFSKIKRNGRKLQVDHKDQNRLNNKYENLQLLTHRENNAKARRGKRKLPIGVYRYRTKRYNSIISIKGIKKNLGYYSSISEAEAAYQKALRGVN